MFEQFLAHYELLKQVPFVLFVIILAFVFEGTNGFHDAPNSIALMVKTKVMSYRKAIVWAAFWNFAATWFVGTAIANTVAKWIFPEFVTPEVIGAGLIGAIVWNLATWAKGIPSSSSHALLGGFGGAAIAMAGTAHGVMHMEKVYMIIAFIFLSPVAGSWISLWLLRIIRMKAPPTEQNTSGSLAKVMQIVSSAAYSCGHGANDSQKTMGIIAALLYCSILKSDQAAFMAGTAKFPSWIIFACYACMALGTLMGGRRIMNTMTDDITNDINPRSAATIGVSAAVVLFASQALGIPVSTTHAINGSIVGAAMENHPISEIYWKKILEIGYTWVITLPGAGLVAALAYWVIMYFRTTHAA
ncbi:MAG: inorganic phosphate transporter [Candidatus Uhrbacteria bacterium]|nr:inorganic phosphate transporter [Candidatus Uhrbacteria bacterium]